MKTVILCGGLGSRLSEETKTKPKPMVKIGKDPILIHVMKIYQKYGFNKFVLALGYKKNNIIDYFNKNKNKKWNIEFVDTGKNSLTGNRLLKLKKKLINEVRKIIGPVASPDLIQWAPGLPKTRSGKIMRRILRKIAADESDQLGDVSTLADPSVVDNLIETRLNKK